MIRIDLANELYILFYFFKNFFKLFFYFLKI